MAKSITTQGINFCSIYTLNSAHDTIGSTPIITLDMTRNTQLTAQDDGSYDLTLDSLMDGTEYWNFYRQYRSIAAGGNNNTDAFFENGTKIPAISGSSAPPPSGSLDLLVVCPLALTPATPTGTDIRTWVSIMNLQSSSGTHQVQWNEYTGFSVAFKSVKAKRNLSVGAAQFSSTLFDAPTPTQIDLDSHGTMAFKKRV
jgi:hypothetical protein